MSNKKLRAVDNASFRLILKPPISFGPGKAALLEALVQTGSISAAGRALGMSYRRAWLLIDAMNQTFKRPVVATAKGGVAGGGAVLTTFGEELLARYRAMEKRVGECLAQDVRALNSQLVKPGA